MFLRRHHETFKIAFCKVGRFVFSDAGAFVTSGWLIFNVAPLVLPSQSEAKSKESPSCSCNKMQKKMRTQNKRSPRQRTTSRQVNIRLRASDFFFFLMVENEKYFGLLIGRHATAVVVASSHVGKHDGKTEKTSSA